jgi:DNA modification methylase
MTTFYKGDCIEQMSKLDSHSIDFIYFNPPFGITKQPWDSKLNWKKIFAECFRLLKDDGTLAIHCSVPFNYTLIREAPRAPNYSWYWNKLAQTTPLLAKKQPLRQVEEILVWTHNKYNPQRVGTEKRIVRNNAKTKYVDYKNCTPQEPKEVIGHYQTHLIEIKKHVRGFATRPDALVELFIKSYTNIGDVILDPTCYKGLSGRIAKSLNRKWIGIDKQFFPTELIE